MSYYVIDNPPEFRTNIRKKFDVFLENQKLSTNLELGVYNYSIKEAISRKIPRKWDNPIFVQIYIDRLKTIYINLKNPDIIQQIRTNELLPQTFAFMTHQEMKPEHWSALIDLKIKRDESKFVTQVESTTTMFICGKCKKNNCSFYELQTRSADEPTTVFISCLECGKKWKM